MTGACALVSVTWLLRQILPITYPGTALWTRATPLVIHLLMGTLAYAGGYILIPSGRGDFNEVTRKLMRRSA